MDGSRGWLNAERGVFIAAAMWLLVMGVGYQNAPVTAHWGPPRVPDAPPDHRSVSLSAPPPIEEFLASERGSPFGDEERKVAFRRPSLGNWRPPTVKRKPPTRVAARPPKPPKPPAPPRKKPTEEKPAAKPKPYDLPVRYIGRIEVGGRNGRTVFVVKENGQYVSVKEGEELPGLGVRVVRATKNVVIVENEKGQRFRLNDLLRARAGGGDDEGGE